MDRAGTIRPRRNTATSATTATVMTASPTGCRFPAGRAARPLGEWSHRLAAGSRRRRALSSGPRWRGGGRYGVRHGRASGVR